MMKLPETRYGFDEFTLKKEAPVNLSGDLLNRRSVAVAIDRAIRATPDGWSTRVGLYGEWGSGKSSILKMLRQLQEERGAIVMEFSAWSASGETGVLALFCEHLKERLDELGVDRPQLLPLAKRFAEISGRAASFTSEHLSKASESAGEHLGPALAAAAAAVSGGSSALRALGKFKPEDLALIAEAARARQVVVYIDDLDRADARALPKTLLALRSLLDWPGFAFVLAFDREVVAQSLAEYSKAYGNAQRFLEKVIDVNFVLEAPGADDSARFAAEVLAICCPFIPERARLSLARFFPSNPRRAKLVARKLAVLSDVAKRHGDDELNWVGLGLQHVLRETNEQVARKFEELGLLGMEASMRASFKKAAAARRGGDSDQDPVATLLDEAMAERLVTETSERKWLADLISALLDARSQQRVDAIQYEMKLLEREPALTKKEYDKFLEGWSSTDVALLKALLEPKEESPGAPTRAEIAEELLVSAVHSYGNKLSAAAEVTLSDDHSALVASAAEDLELLEVLATTAHYPEVRDIRQSAAFAAQVYALFSQWCHFTGNESDRSLRQRELALMRTLGRQCEDQVALYLETDPSDLELSAYQGMPNREDILAFRGAMRASISDATCDQVLTWFREPRLISEAIGGLNYKLAGWLVCSANSPLHATEHGRTSLKAVFDSARTSAADSNAGVILRNILSYLVAMSGLEGGWGGPVGTRQELFTQIKDILLSAWGTLSAPERQHRAIYQLYKVRDALIASGLTAEELPMPAWLPPESVATKETAFDDESPVGEEAGPLM
jgi:hypothetical protein